MSEEPVWSGREEDQDADILTAALLDELGPVLAWWRVECARALGLDGSAFACVSLLVRQDRLSATVIGERTGLTRSAVSKLLRRLEEAGHVELRGGGGPGLTVEARLRPHPERDAQLERLHRELRTKLRFGAIAEHDADRRRAAVRVLRRAGDALHLAAAHRAGEVSLAARVEARRRRDAGWSADRAG